MTVPEIIQHDDIPGFLAIAPVSESFRDFVEGRASLVQGRVQEPIVLSNGSDSAASFSLLGRQTWAMKLEFLANVDEAAMIQTSRAMIDWMFDHGAANIAFQGRDDSGRFENYFRSIGARSLGKAEDCELFVIPRRVN